MILNFRSNISSSIISQLLLILVLVVKIVLHLLVLKFNLRKLVTVRSLPIIIILLLFYFVFWGPIAGSMGAPLRIRRLNFNIFWFSINNYTILNNHISFIINCIRKHFRRMNMKDLSGRSLKITIWNWNIGKTSVLQLR